MRHVGLSLLAVLLSAAPIFAQHPAHGDVVAGVKAQLAAQGIELSGACGAFSITKRVAWLLRAEGLGLLDKPGGNNCQGYATDFLVYQDGVGVDILGDSGGANIPAWQAEFDAGLIGRWRPPVDPGETPPPPPIVIAPDLSGQILAELRAHEAAEKAEREEAAKFRDEVRRAWRDRFVFISKYILPVLGAIFAGRATK